MQTCMLKDKSLKTKHQIVIQWLCSGSLDIHLVPRQEKKEKIGGFERAMGIQHRGRVDVSYCKDTFILYFACIFCMHRFYPLPVAVCLYAPLGSDSAPGQFDYFVIMTGKYTVCLQGYVTLCLKAVKCVSPISLIHVFLSCLIMVLR